LGARRARGVDRRCKGPRPLLQTSASLRILWRDVSTINALIGQQLYAGREKYRGVHLSLGGLVSWFPPARGSLLHCSLSSVDLSSPDLSTHIFSGGVFSHLWNIRICRSLPTDSRDPLSGAMIGPSIPLSLASRWFWGPPSFARPPEVTSLCGYTLATIPTFSSRACLELPPTSNGSSRYAVRGQL